MNLCFDKIKSVRINLWDDNLPSSLHLYIFQIIGYDEFGSNCYAFIPANSCLLFDVHTVLFEDTWSWDLSIIHSRKKARLCILSLGKVLFIRWHTSTQVSCRQRKQLQTIVEKHQVEVSHPLSVNHSIQYGCLSCYYYNEFIEAGVF